MNRNVFLTRRAAQWILLVLLIWLATFLRFYSLGRESLWDGEIFTLLFTQYDWAKLVPSVGIFSAHPPLWFVLTKVLTAFGWNETILRAPAAFFAILAVPALYALGKRLFDARVGLIGAALLAVSPISVLFAQNARNYALFIFLAILLVYAAYRATEKPFTCESKPLTLRDWKRAGWWFLFTGCALAGLYTHYLFILPLVGTVLAIALKLMNDAARISGGWRNVRGWWGLALVSARPFLIALIAISLLYLPWVPTVGSAFVGRQLEREAGQAAGDEDAAITIQDLPRLFKDFTGTANWGLILFALLAVIGIVYAWRVRKQRPALFWFGMAYLLPIALMVVLAPRRLPAKYLIYVLPAYLLFTANGIAWVSKFLGVRTRSPGVAYGVSAAMFAVLAIATVPNMPYWNGAQAIFTGKGWQVVDDWKPWRQVAAQVAARVQPGNFVLFPEEARALTARSVVPYWNDAFYVKLYSAPPNGEVWWVSEQQDLPPATDASFIQGQQNFGPVVVQQSQHTPEFQQIDLANASFEDGFKNWDKPAGIARWERDDAQVVDGSASARVTMTKPDFATLRSTPFDVTPGKLYRVTAYVKAPTIGFYTTSPQLGVNFYADTDGPPKRTRVATLLPSDKPGWVLMVNDGIVPADAKTARVEFLFRDYAYDLGPTSWIDNVKVWVEK